ncbi:hypothetical protein HYS50_00395 [Candidatus Woesearchaeota archaeon]|nr:hypothetical protein [Candidatus Woesearchaeota archaeon]
MSKLLSLLDACKELKAEYGIGTKDAYQYLKIRNTYRGLRDEVAKELAKQKIQYHPTERKVSNVCSKINADLKTIFRDILDEDVDVKQYTDHLQSIISKEDKQLCIPYKEILIKYCAYAMTEAPDQAYRHMVKDLLKNHQFLDESGLIFFSITLNNIRDLPSLENLIKEDMRIRENHLNEMQQLLGMKDGPREKYLEFLEWINEGQEVIWYGTFDPTGITLEEQAYLFQLGCGIDSSEKSPYERALQEKTLRKLETERRIALQEMILYKHTNVENAIKDVDKMISNGVQDLPKYQEFPDLQSRLKFSINRFRYLSQAIKKNRKWLETVLSR